MGNLLSIYRAIVCDVDDPFQQGRVRVFVYGIHRPIVNPSYPSTSFSLSSNSSGAPQTVIPALQESSYYVELMHDGGNSNEYDDDNGPINYLPWAEIVGDIGRHKGDIYIPRIGDKVLVMFEYGDPSQPFVIGGWGTGLTATIPTLFPEQRVVDYVPYPVQTIPSGGSVSGVLNTEYADSLKNWIRADEVGNSLEFSGIPYSTWARMRGGGAEAVWSGNDNFLNFTTECAMTFNTSLMTMDSFTAMIASAPIMVFETKRYAPASYSSTSSGSTIQTDGNETDQNLMGRLYMALYSHWGMDLWASDWIGVGQYLDQAGPTSNSSSSSSNSPWHQTRAVLMAPKHLVLGTIPECPYDPYQEEAALPYLSMMYPTQTITMAATQFIRFVAANQSGSSTSSSSGSSAGPCAIGLYAQGALEMLTDDYFWLGQCHAQAEECGLTPYTPQPGDGLIGALNNLILSAGGSIRINGWDQNRLATLASDGGSNGGVSTGGLFYATYTYTATDYETGQILAHNLSPYFRRPYPGLTSPAVAGELRRVCGASSGASGNAAWMLVFCDEQFDFNYCAYAP